MLKLRMRCAGAADFEVELEPSATVQDAKIAATAGCDLDPQVMRIIVKGKILKDEDILESFGVCSGESLHIARGPAAAPPPNPTPAAPAATAAPGAAFEPVPRSATVVAAGGAELRIALKAPGGVDEVLPALAAELPVERLREIVASRCRLKPEQIHLLHKAKMLADGQSLVAAGLADGSVLRVARRQQPAAAPAAPAGGATGATSAEYSALAGPMPMAWGGAGAGLPSGPPGQEEAMRMAMMQLMEAQARGQPPRGETGEEMQARFAREAREMAERVRNYLQAEHEGEGVVEDDSELLADIAGMLAECRSRGAPVPNTAVFVDRAVARRREMQRRQVRLDREASGLDPDLEDALAAAEVAVAAAERMPRRLGHGPAGPAGPRHGTAGGGAPPPGPQ